MSPEVVFKIAEISPEVVFKIALWVLELVGVALGAAAGLYWLNRRAYHQALEKAAAGWKALAELRDQEIGELKQRVAALEADLRRVVAENEELRRLNLVYQNRLMEMQVKISRIEEREGCSSGLEA